jgi:hypothetical protein
MLAAVDYGPAVSITGPVTDDVRLSNFIVNYYKVLSQEQWRMLMARLVLNWPYLRALAAYESSWRGGLEAIARGDTEDTLEDFVNFLDTNYGDLELHGVFCDLCGQPFLQEHHPFECSERCETLNEEPINESFIGAILHGMISEDLTRQTVQNIFHHIQLEPYTGRQEHYLQQEKQIIREFLLEQFNLTVV